MGNNMPQKPQNAADLKKLLKQYNNILTPQNKQFITELIQRLENGSDNATIRRGRAIILKTGLATASPSRRPAAAKEDLRIEEN